METTPDPFEEGKAAAAQGKPASSNPYPPDSDDHEDWAEGTITLPVPMMMTNLRTMTKRAS